MPCAAHKRPSASARGYNSKHRRTREQWRERVEAGVVKCWRCRELIAPDEPWDLGHIDADEYGGPEHAYRCNRSAAGKATHESN